MPKVSVIIATHSRPTLLPRAVESARESGSDVEVVVVDDASTDSTAEVCRRMTGIHYVRIDRNQGVGGARNVGILSSTGEFISFHDDDDVRFPGSIDWQLDRLTAYPEAGMVYAPIIHGDLDCNPTGIVDPADPLEGDLFWNLLEHMFVPTLSMVFRRSCIQRVGMLNATIPGFDDWDLCVRIAELYPIIATKEPIGIWRIATPDSGQGSSKIAPLWRMFARQQLKLMTLPRARADKERCRQVRKATLAWMSDRLIWDAATWLNRGASERARNSLITALRLNPLRASRPWTFQLIFESLRSRPQVGP